MFHFNYMGYTALNSRMNVKDELQRVWKKCCLF